jgi:nitrous oxide reductase
MKLFLAVILIIVTITGCIENHRIIDCADDKEPEICCYEKNKNEPIDNCIGSWKLVNDSCSYVCESKDEIVFPSEEDEYYKIIYENNTLFYEAIITKPTPCHNIEVNEKIINRTSVQVTIDMQIKSYKGVCIQVLKEEKVSGEIYVANLTYASLYLDGDLKYSQKINSK